MTRTLAIDGPAGSGKSTVADELARRLAMHHLDTGAMYRAITLDLLRQSIDVSQEQEVARRLPDIHLVMRPNGVELNGEDVTKEIRGDAVTANVSRVSSYGAVRTHLVAMQREIASQADIILDGRDIGTVVLPDATLKIFLTASPEVRAMRRLHDVKASSDMDYETILAAMKTRDELDTNRAISPLRPAEDAILLDTSDLDLEQVVARIEQEWRQR